MPGKFVVFAERFEKGVWVDWEHTCDEDEALALEDTAKVKAVDRGNFGDPLYVDYLKGAVYVFNVARGPAHNPREGDTRVFGIAIDEIVIAHFERLRQHFELKKIA